LLLSVEDVVGQPRASAVEQDQPAKRREPLQECAGVPPTPDLAETETARDEHEVDCAAPCDLIGDMDSVGRLGVAGLRDLHECILDFGSYGPQPRDRTSHAPSSPSKR
jgi:hypothetical protein